MIFGRGCSSVVAPHTVRTSIQQRLVKKALECPLPFVRLRRHLSPHPDVKGAVGRL